MSRGSILSELQHPLKKNEIYRRICSSSVPSRYQEGWWIQCVPVLGLQPYGERLGDAKAMLGNRLVTSKKARNDDGGGQISRNFWAKNVKFLIEYSNSQDTRDFTHVSRHLAKRYLGQEIKEIRGACKFVWMKLQSFASKINKSVSFEWNKNYLMILNFFFGIQRKKYHWSFERKMNIRYT